MKRIEYIDKIVPLAAKFVLEVEAYNAAQQYHINIHAENFLIPVLNKVFELKLENLNATQKKNFPAVDLADFKNRVAFQITSTSSFEKIKGTLETFSGNELQHKFDVLYFYILTEKKPQYNRSKLNQIIPDYFHFDPDQHIIDKDIIIKKISELSSTPKIYSILKIYEHEFSEVQIEQRKHKFENGYLSNNPEPIIPNIAEISFPKILYKAELCLDEQEILQNLNSYLKNQGKKPVKKLQPDTLIKKALIQNKIYLKDWISHETNIYTFRNLNNADEALRKILDISSITSLECKEFYEQNEASLRVFKYLLRKTLTQLCIKKGIECFGPYQIYRFSNTVPPRKKTDSMERKKGINKNSHF